MRPGQQGLRWRRVLSKRAGVACVVAAPGKIERPAQDRVKTDRRDAERLVRLLMVDGLHPVRVPSIEEEALRDLVRAREDIRSDLMRARHRMGKLLLRYDVTYDGPGVNWSTRHRRWLGCVKRAEPGAHAALLDHLGAIADALGVAETGGLSKVWSLLRGGSVVVGVEVVAVDSREAIRVGRGDANAVVDHQAGELAAVYQDDAWRHAVGVVAGAAREGRGGDEDTLGGPLAVEGTEEISGSPGVRPGRAHFLAWT